MSNGASQFASTAHKDVLEGFMEVFPDVVRDLTEAGGYSDISEIAKWYAKVLKYNVPHGKKIRGLAVVIAYKIIEDSCKLSAENVKLANIMGWCVEILQASLLVFDDIIDGSELSRGAPCWYKNPGVGLYGINDAMLLEQGVYFILRKHFSNHPCYLQMIELFHDVSFKTWMGQSLDNFSLKDGRSDLEAFTMKRYNSIVKYKTAYYTFHLPIGLAMYLAGKSDPKMHAQVNSILLEMGSFYQVQDDYLDCFGDAELVGKKSSDIREGKCTWLVVVALQRANPDQRLILEENYGKSEPEAIQAVCDLYWELGLNKIYSTFEEDTLELISTLIQQVSEDPPHDVFFRYMEMINKRKR